MTTAFDVKYSVFTRFDTSHIYCADFSLYVILQFGFTAIKTLFDWYAPGAFCLRSQRFKGYRCKLDIWNYANSPIKRLEKNKDSLSKFNKKFKGTLYCEWGALCWHLLGNVPLKELSLCHKLGFLKPISLKRP